MDIFEAIKNKQISVLEELLSNGIDVNATNEYGETPLCRAVLTRGAGCIVLLIEKGADVNATDENGKTPLYRAAMNGYTGYVELLIQKGADVNATNEDGETPLHKAAQRGYTECVELLIKKGADVNATNEDGETPLHKAAQGRYTECVELLIKKGADVNATNKYGQTTLFGVVEYGNEGFVKLLIKKGADVNHANNCGETPLHKAAFVASEGCVELLLKADADINATNEDDETPLFKTAWHGIERFVKLLIERGADVNHANKHGQTTLFIAAWHGKKGLAKLLIEAGADVNHANNCGKTPLDWAAKNGHEGCVELLNIAKIADDIINEGNFNNPENIEIDDTFKSLILKRVSSLIKIKLSLADTIEEFIDIQLNIEKYNNQDSPVRLDKEVVEILKVYSTDMQTFLSSVLEINEEEKFSSVSFSMVYNQIQQNNFNKDSLLQDIKKHIKFLAKQGLMDEVENTQQYGLVGLESMEQEICNSYYKIKDDLKILFGDDDFEGGKEESLVEYTEEQKQEALSRVKLANLAINMNLMQQVVQQFAEDKDDFSAEEGVYLKDLLSGAENIIMPRFIKTQFDEVLSRATELNNEYIASLQDNITDDSITEQSHIDNTPENDDVEAIELLGD